jgi:hypothetical protein
MVAGLFGLAIPWLGGWALPVWPWIIAGILAGWALIWPQGLNPVYRGWMKIGLTIGGVVNRIVLGIAFYLLFFPIGLIMRVFSRDPMARALDPSKNSYRIPSKPAPKRNMEKPF